MTEEEKSREAKGCCFVVALALVGVGLSLTAGPAWAMVGIGAMLLIALVGTE